MSAGDKLAALVQQLFDDDPVQPLADKTPATTMTMTDSIVRQKSSSPERISLYQQFQQQKEARNRGESYHTCRGQRIPPRKLGPPCGPSCRLRCTSRLGSTDRNNLFREFWCIADHTSQWEFISHHVAVAPKVKCAKGTVDESRRAYTRTYFFRRNGTIELVCKTMFMNTLGITNQWIATVCKKMAKNGYISADGRGKNGRKKEYVPV